MRHPASLQAGYPALERATKRVVRHSITTLREITIGGDTYWGDGRASQYVFFFVEMEDTFVVRCSTERLATHSYVPQHAPP